MLLRPVNFPRPPISWRPATQTIRAMATPSQPTTKPHLSHAERTAQQPRASSLHTVSVASITETASNSIRLLRLRVKDQDRGIEFRPGQWLDVHVPALPKPGGFTITSPPLVARALSLQDAGQRERYAGLFRRFSDTKDGTRDVQDSASAVPDYPFLDLAVQYSPKNPPAVWLWQEVNKVLDSELQVRVGGDFVWPPALTKSRGPEKAVFIAGGVGINPLMAMLADIYVRNEGWPAAGVTLWYGHKVPDVGAVGRDLEEQVLFLERLRRIAEESEGRLAVQLFLTNNTPKAQAGHDGASVRRTNEVIHRHGRRMMLKDVETALGDDLKCREQSVVYICGPQAMTDEFVQGISTLQGMSEDRILCEKWW